MKKLLIIVGAIIVVLILAVVIAPFFISADAYKGQILSRVRDATGRDMRINGKLSLGFFPNVSVNADDVTLANAPGAESPTMAKLKTLDISVKLIPLLSGRIEVERLVLVDPQINLEIDAQGKPSWSFAESGATLPAPAPGAAPSKNPSMMGLATLSRLQVKDVSIQNGDIILLDRRTNQHYELQQVALTLSAPSLDAPFTMDGSAMWRGQKVAISVKLDSTGALVQSGGKTGITVALNSTPVTLKFTGSASNAGGDAGLGYDGNADLAVPSVRNLVAWSGLNLTLPKNSGFGALSLSGSVHAGSRVAKFTNGKFALDTIKATGALTLDVTGARPNVTGELQSGVIDLNPYLPPSGPSNGWNANPFDVTMLRQVDAQLTVAADGAKFRKITVGKTNAVVTLKDGKADIDISQVALYRGSSKGDVKVDATGAAAAFTFNGSMSGVDIGSLMRDAGEGAGVGGSGNFSMTGTARGNSERDLVSTLSGKATFRISNGSVGGYDLGGMMRNTSSAFSGGGATAIRSASADYTIRNGIMTTRNLVVSTSSVDATGTGSVSLPSRTLNFHVVPKLVAGLITVPVNVTGPWDHPSFQPDLAGIAGGIVSAPAKALGGAAGGAGRIGEGVTQGVGGALKGLFGN